MAQYFKLLPIAILIVVMCTSCVGDVDLSNPESVPDPSLEYKDYSFNNIRPNMADEIPEDFVSLADIKSEYGEILTVGFFESQIYILDLDDVNIFQTTISNSNFLVQYKNDIYISRKTINDIRIKADETFAKRKYIYTLGESIDLFNGQQEPMAVILKEVSYTDSFENIALKENEWFCVVDIVLEGNDLIYNSVWEYFDSAELENGQKIVESLKIDSDYLIFKLPKHEKVKYLFAALHIHILRYAKLT